MHYVTKPRLAEAIQFDGTNLEEIATLLGPGRVRPDPAFTTLAFVETSGGPKIMRKGDWVIRDRYDGWTHIASTATFERVWQEEEEAP